MVHVYHIRTAHCDYYESPFLIIHERLECPDSKLRSDNCTLSHYLKQICLMGILEQLFRTAEPDIIVGLYIYQILHNFC